MAAGYRFRLSKTQVEFVTKTPVYGFGSLVR